jgi:hypothetical protein
VDSYFTVDYQPLVIIHGAIMMAYEQIGVMYKTSYVFLDEDGI